MAAGGAHRRVGRALPVRLPLLRGHRPHRPPAARPEEGAARRRVVRRPGPLHPVSHHRLGGDVSRGVRQGRGGHPGQARRVALHQRALHRLAQDQVRAPAGIRRSAATPSRRAPASIWAPCWWATTTAGLSATPARSAPGTTATPWSCSIASWRRSSAAPRPSRRARCRRGKSSGSRRSWWRRSASASGPRRACSAIPRFLGLRDDKAAARRAAGVAGVALTSLDLHRPRVVLQPLHHLPAPAAGSANSAPCADRQVHVSTRALELRRSTRRGSWRRGWPSAARRPGARCRSGLAASGTTTPVHRHRPRRPRAPARTPHRAAPCAPQNSMLRCGDRDCRR